MTDESAVEPEAGHGQSFLLKEAASIERLFTFDRHAPLRLESDWLNPDWTRDDGTLSLTPAHSVGFVLGKSNLAAILDVLLYNGLPESVADGEDDNPVVSVMGALQNLAGFGLNPAVIIVCARLGVRDQALVLLAAAAGLSVSEVLARALKDNLDGTVLRTLAALRGAPL